MTSPEVTLPPFNRLSELPPGECTTQLGYGESGSGKTEYLGSGGDRVLIIDTGGGMETLKSPGFRNRHPNCNPMIVSVTERIGDIRGDVEIATMYDATCDIIDYARKHLRDQIDTIAVDDTTALRRGAMNKGLEAGQKLGKSHTLKKSRDLDVGVTDPEIQDYKFEMQLMTKFLFGTTELARAEGWNFIMMAHERLTLTQPRNEKGVPIIGGEVVVKDIRPGFTGKTFPDEITGYFDEIWHFEVVSPGPVFRARIIGGDNLTAKTRHGGIWTDSVIKNPILADVLTKIKQSAKKG